MLISLFLNANSKMIPISIIHISYSFLELPATPLLRDINIDKLKALGNVVRTSSNFVILLSYFDNKAWIRISANVYNSKNDYIELRNRFASFFKIDSHIE